MKALPKKELYFFQNYFKALKIISESSLQGNVKLKTMFSLSLFDDAPSSDGPSHSFFPRIETALYSEIRASLV